MANEIDTYTKRRLSQRYILWLTASTVAGGWAVALPLYGWLPQYYTPLYPYIMLYFYVWALGFAWMLNRPVRDGRLSTQVYPAVPVLVPGLSDFRNPVLLAV